MKLLDTIRKQLDSVEATNASKLYTPFTLFCMFFAVYFNADILGSIFLSSKWEVKSAALSLLANRGWGEWLAFSLKVISYSIGLMVLYGLAQACAAFIWGISNWANIWLSSISNRTAYVSKVDYHKALEQSDTLRKNEKLLYARIAEYHQWAPEDLTRLQKINNDQEEIIASKDREIVTLTRDEAHLIKLGEELEEKKGAIESFKHLSEYKTGYMEAICTAIKHPKFNSDFDRIDESFDVICNLFDKYGAFNFLESCCESKRRYRLMFIEMNYQSGAGVALLEAFKIAQITNVVNDDLAVLNKVEIEFTDWGNTFLKSVRDNLLEDAPF